MRKSWVFRFLLGVSLLPFSAFADPFLHFWEPHEETQQRFKLSPQVLYYSTTANYDADHTKVDLPNEGKYSMIGGDVGLAYGVAKDWTLFARISWARWKAEDASVESSSFGLTDQLLGASFIVAHFESGAKISLQAQAEIPAYDNDSLRAKGNPNLGNQSLDLTSGGFAHFPLSQSEIDSWWLVGGAGFTARTKDYEKNLSWSAGVERKPVGKGVCLGVHANGALAFSSETSATGGANSAGSSASGSLNPSIFHVREKLGFAIDPEKMIFVGAQQSLWGKNAPQGYAYFAGAEIRFGGDDVVSDSPERLKPGTLPPVDLAPPSGFVRYSSKEAKVTGINDRLHLVRLDRGSSDGIEIGQYYDLFSLKPDGTPAELVARGKVSSVKSNEAALQIVQYYKEIWIQEGFIAKQPLP